jgi:hypothetical protein
MSSLKLPLGESSASVYTATAQHSTSDDGIMNAIRHACSESKLPDLRAVVVCVLHNKSHMFTSKCQE